MFLMILWKMCFMFKEFPSTSFLFIVHARKVIWFEAWLDKYVLKYIKHNFQIVSLGHVDHNVGLYKLTSFNSNKNQLFYYYVAHADEQSKLWHEISGHLNYGKMLIISKMVLGLPSISCTKGVCEGCALGKHHYWGNVW